MTLLVGTPLAFGTVEPWSIALAEVLIFTIALAWGLAMVARRDIRIERTPLNLCWFLAMGVGFLQVLPLPLQVIGVLSPKAYALYQEMAFDNGLMASWRTLSLHPYATKHELIKLLALALLFWVTANHLRTREQVDRVVRVVIAMGFLLAVFGMAQNFSGTLKIYGVRSLKQSEHLFGPYVNRNHFAGYMEMVIPLSLGYLVAIRRHWHTGSSSWRDRLLHWGTPEASRSLLIFFVALMMVAALLLTGSRGGLFSFVGSMLIVAFLLSIRPTRRRKPWALPVVLIALGFAYALWIKPDVVPRTLAILRVGIGDASAHSRFLIWQDTLRIGQDYPWIGTGLNTFDRVFPLYYRRPSQDYFFYSHAHNDYLQTFAEGGLLLAAVLALGLFWGGGQLLNGWRHTEGTHARGIGLGLLAGLAALLIHSAIDFNLHIMANAILFVVLLGLAYRVIIFGCPRAALLDHDGSSPDL